jgi:methylthioribose-1-phosphate isomerase
MQDLIAASLRYENGQLLVLDQRRLPAEENWQCWRNITTSRSTWWHR